MSYMTDEILKQISSFDTSSKAWLVLENNFSSRSRAQAIQLKEKLQNRKYVNCLVYTQDQVACRWLQAVGFPMSEEKLMSVLSGLDESFDKVFSTITEKMLNEKIIVNDAKALPLNYESRLELRRLVSISPLPNVNLSIKDRLKQQCC